MSQPQGTATAEELLETWLNDIGAEDNLIHGEFPNEYVKVWDEGEMEEGSLTGSMKKVKVPTFHELINRYGI